MQDARRLDLTWLGEETSVYDRLHNDARAAAEPMPQFVKKVLRLAITKK